MTSSERIVEAAAATTDEDSACDGEDAAAELIGRLLNPACAASSIEAD